MKQHFLTCWHFIRSLWWLVPFLVIGTLFVAFFLDRLPGLPKELESRGQFGDSFGVLNTLFTGLGFAGLLVTIRLQQKQINKQARDFQTQVHDAEIRRFEENFYRLLALYQEALSSVISTKDGQTTKGRDVLRQATESILKTIRQDRINSVPHDVQKRYRENALTTDDRLLLDYLFYRNFWHLNYSLIRQGRLLDTLKALLRHLEHAGPQEIPRDTYRNVASSQVTHIEISYFLLIALGAKQEDELRELLVASNLIRKASHVYKLQIHRLMYLEYWGYDLSRNKEERSLPMAKSRIKTVRKEGPKLASHLKVPSKSPEPNELTPASESEA